MTRTASSNLSGICCSARIRPARASAAKGKQGSATTGNDVYYCRQLIDQDKILSRSLGPVTLDPDLGHEEARASVFESKAGTFYAL